MNGLRSICGFRERRGPNEISTIYPTDSEKTGIYWFQPLFGRTFFSSAITLTHPSLNQEPRITQRVADYLYEAFLMAVPVERRDVGVAVDRHRRVHGPLAEGSRFIALYDQTYGSLRISGRVLEEHLLAPLLETAIDLCEEDGGVDGTLEARAVLRELAEAANAQSGEKWWARSAVVVAAGDNVAKVIMPGSIGLQLLHDNREFYVEDVFFSPQGLRYRGHHEATRHGVTEIVSIDQLAPLEGVSKTGLYDLETGELTEIETVPATI